jgi:hypothetical protein
MKHRFGIVFALLAVLVVGANVGGMGRAEAQIVGGGSGGEGKACPFQNGASPTPELGVCQSPSPLPQR